MQPETAKLLLDMQYAADRIGRFVVGKTFNDYVADELLRSGVERQFAIIGEALWGLNPTIDSPESEHSVSMLGLEMLRESRGSTACGSLSRSRLCMWALI